MCSVQFGQWTKSQAFRRLLSFDQEQALTGEHEEVLLRVLAVVHRARLARAQDAETDADLVETRVLASNWT